MKKLILFLISIICPGSAHLFLRQTLKAVVILLSLLFHFLFMLALYKHQLFSESLTIVMWLIALCIHCFYSMFDALQQYEYQFGRKKKASLRLKLALASILVWGIAVIAALFFADFANNVIYFYPYTLMIFIALYLVTHIKSDQWKAIYVGRWSAIVFLSCIILTGFGFEFIWYHIQIKTVILLYIFLFGLEVSIFYLLKRLNKMQMVKLKLDSVAFVTVSLLATVFIIVPKYGHLPSELLKSFHNVDRFEYNYDITHYQRKQLQPLSVTMNEQTEILKIKNRNGLVKVESYSGDYIKIVPTRYDVSNAEFQTKIETTNIVEVSIEGNQTVLNTKLAEHEGQVSKMDIVIYIPYTIKFKQLQLFVENGLIQLDHVKQFDNINVDGQTVNVDSLYSSGDMSIKLNDGNSYIYKHNGKLTVNTTSGHIMLNDILREIRAETLNGNILISNSYLFESIYTHAGVGSVQISVPKILTYNLTAETSFGKITIGNVIYENNISFKPSVNKKEINIYADQDIVID